MAKRPDEKIIARIKKMLALANNNPEAEEADTAMRMALSTLAKYGLTMADVSEDESGNPVVEFDLWSRLNSPWTRRIAWGVAQLYFCSYFYQRHGQKIQHVFVGQQNHVEVAKEIADWLICSANRQATKEQKELGEPFAYRTEFLKAAANRIYARCQDMIREAKTGSFDDGMGSKALVPVSMYEETAEANEEYLAKYSFRKPKGRERDTFNARAAAAGDRWGRTASLNKQIR